MKMNRAALGIGALLGVFVITPPIIKNKIKNQVIAENCTGEHRGKMPEDACHCVVNRLMDDVAYVNFIPVLSWVLPNPDPMAGGPARKREIIQQCS